MNRVDRLMGMVTMLQAQSFVSAARLGERFGISLRTVYRDIQALGEIGIPVSFAANKGYFIVDGYFLPPISFTPDQANALVLLASLADRFADESVTAQVAEAVEKVRAVLKLRDQEKLETLRDRIRVLQPSREGLTGNTAYLGDIQKSISGSVILAIDYTDLKGQRTLREIEPIGIIYYTNQWHLIAWCWLRHGYRDFIVRQINGLRLTSEVFRKTNHISIDAHIETWKLG